MDRITTLHIKNMRAIEYMALEVSPVTVLIGENGSGKSTVLEGLELLRKAAEPSFFQQLYQVHHGLPGLLRKGATELGLGVVIEDSEGQQPRIHYDFTLVPQGSGAVIESEQLLIEPAEGKALTVLRRSQSEVEIFGLAGEGGFQTIHKDTPKREELALASFGSHPPHEAIKRTLAVLTRFEIHLGFDTLASWAVRAVGRTNQIRNSTMLFPAERLSMLGHNLANAWSALKNFSESHWKHTMALVRLGLGDHVDSVNVVPDSGGGNISLALKQTNLPEPIPAAYLSDGQLAWLGFIAMARLNQDRSLLAVDEPDLHLHPSLLGRVVLLLTQLEGAAPVILSTHSDRVLELLEDPASAVRVCSLEGSKAVVAKLDRTKLPLWLEKFGNIGELRASGYLPRLLVPASEDETGASGEDK